MFVIRDEDGNTLKNPAIVDLIIIKRNGGLLSWLKILII